MHLQLNLNLIRDEMNGQMFYQLQSSIVYVMILPTENKCNLNIDEFFYLGILT